MTSFTSANANQQAAKKAQSHDRTSEQEATTRMKLIVDKDIGNTRINGIHDTILEALSKA